jgi:surfactin family lipopeptide synthetase C
LSQHPAVQEVLVAAREEMPGEKQLVAYVVTKAETSVSSAETNGADPRTPLSGVLRRYLRSRLPDYMIPNAFVLLEAFPLSPNGKIDRKALPAPVMSADLSPDTFVAPETPTEIALAEIWSALLGVAPIGRHDDFFALGGHSLLATQVMARIREDFAPDLPLRLLFEHTTIAQLAEAVEVQQLSTVDEESLLQALSAIGMRPY